MNISEFTKCSNCGACYNVCPKKAITINKSKIFFEPEVNSHLCVDCGLCLRVCPVNSEFEKKEPLYACAGWHSDEKVVLKSSSGGAFFAIAQKIISSGGVVFAAVYSENFKNVEFASSDEVPLSKMQKSKYVESTVGLSFQRIKDELEKGRNVLFCGTPCQAAGLSMFLRKMYDNLIICDFACGGLPSHHIYDHYLNRMEEKYHSIVKSVDFRPKTHGWKRYAVKICFENEKVYNKLGIEDDYLKSFLCGRYTVRDYCLECKFSDCHAADITIADFWRHENLSTLNNTNGISLILCNSEKGKRLIDSISDQFSTCEVDLDKASYNHKKTELSASKVKKHKDFLDLYSRKGLHIACCEFIQISLISRMRNRLARIIYRRR